MNEKNPSSHITRRGKFAKRVIAPVVVAGGIASSLYIASGEGDASAPGKADPKYDCGIRVTDFGPDTLDRSTLGGLADTFNVDQSKVEIYDGTENPIVNPAENMRPGDIAVAHIGKTACFDLKGELVNSNLPGAQE